MESTQFTATLLRTSARAFASMAVSRTFEVVEPDGEFEAWQAHFRTLVLELAAAVDDGNREQFAARVAWVQAAFTARGLQTDGLRTGLEELGTVLRESLPSEAWAPLPEFFAAAHRELAGNSTPGEVRGPIEGPVAELVSAYLELLREGNGVGAIELVISAIREQRLSIPDALDGVLTGALHEIGRLWHADVANVAEEHFATQTTGRLLEQVMLLAPRPASCGRTVLLTMAEGDAHDLGLRIVAAFFELDGWRTICLGANTPSVDLSLVAQSLDADLIVIGATLNTQRAAVAHALEVLRRSRPDQKVLIGGPAYLGLEGRALEIGAHGCALDPREALRQGRELVGA